MKYWFYIAAALPVVLWLTVDDPFGAVSNSVRTVTKWFGSDVKTQKFYDKSKFKGKTRWYIKFHLLLA